MEFLLVNLTPLLQPFQHELVGIFRFYYEEIDQHRFENGVHSLFDLLPFAFRLRLLHLL